ncbi:MAG: enoyl-CoA hydratase/isomerase family protein [Deltaproteobacteria bacterium]|nr:enoyl-CoA hydratase/isomerase family protein [Deltaproteobacteria bacterium]MBW2659248.1 enoyl-CoA hydratase/isomerase family protein [Deltaproteobacteria bacterium]
MKSPSTKGRIELQISEQVARLTIVRPAKRNSFDDRLIDLFVEVVESLVNEDIRAVVLTGSGRDSFCAGYDISCIDPDQSLDEPLPDVRFERIIDALKQIPVPVIAVLNGDAYGGGLDLALSCDFRVARRGIRVAMTPCRLGLVYSASGISRFVVRLGPQVTRRLFLTALPFTDEQLLSYGIVDELVEEAELTACALRLVKAVAANAPSAVSGTKYTIDQVENGLAAKPDVKRQLEFHRYRAFSSPELRHRLDTFKKK